MRSEAERPGLLICRNIAITLINLDRPISMGANACFQPPTSPFLARCVSTGVEFDKLSFLQVPMRKEPPAKEPSP
jgi:hypothetical protein